MSVTISNDGQRVTLSAPYSADLPAAAKAIGGRWSVASRAWTFDARDEDRVRDLARQVYGTDGSDADEPGVTVRVELDKLTDGWTQSVSLVGHELAFRPARDTPVRLGRGVVVVAGELEGSGGSIANPRIGDVGGVVLEVRDLPRGTAERALASHPRAVALLDSEAIDRTALAAERERLLARLVEIDAILGG